MTHLNKTNQNLILNKGDLVVVKDYGEKDKPFICVVIKTYPSNTSYARCMNVDGRKILVHVSRISLIEAS